MVGLLVILYMTVIGMTMVLLFLDSRYSRRQTILAVYSTMVLVMVVLTGMYRAAGLTAVIRHYSLVVHIPSLLLFMVLSRFRGWRLVFQLLSAILFCALIQHGAGLAYYLSGNHVWMLLLAYAIFTVGVIGFLLRVLRPLFLQILLELQHGWWLMCLVMAGYYGIIIYLIPGYVGVDRNSTILKPAISLLMVGFYLLQMYLFSSIRKESEARHSAQIYALQASALQGRMEGVKIAEEAIRTERHDMRHRFQTVMELVARGDRETALQFLDAAQKRLDEQKEVRWCRPPILDAVLSSYFDQARFQGIRVEARIALPDTLPVDEGELAVALANALENAIHANMELAAEHRELHCKAVGSPGVMFEISNPCAGKVVFDSRGLPVADREGHGLGMQSISAFCQKYGAVFQFELKDGWFRFRLVL